MDKKYEFTKETKVVNGITLHRIRALRKFGDVDEDELGGFIEKEENLSHEGNAWVGDTARIEDNNDYLCFKGLGSCNRDTTFFKCSDGGIKVICGCFFGTLTEFEKKVKETHGESKYAKEYLACVEVVRVHFGLEVEAEPVKHGYWASGEIITFGGRDISSLFCSKCLKVACGEPWTYCPNCGARMDGEMT